MIYDTNAVTGQFWAIHLTFHSHEEFNAWKQRHKQELIEIGVWKGQGTYDHHSFIMRRQSTFIHCHIKTETKVEADPVAEAIPA